MPIDSQNRTLDVAHHVHQMGIRHREDHPPSRVCTPDELAHPGHFVTEKGRVLYLGQTLLVPIDGVTPPAFNGDWFKVDGEPILGFTKVVTADGNPTKVESLGAYIPDVPLSLSQNCASETWCQGTERRTEPAWSALHADWNPRPQGLSRQ